MASSGVKPSPISCLKLLDIRRFIVGEDCRSPGAHRCTRLHSDDAVSRPRRAQIGITLNVAEIESDEQASPIPPRLRRTNPNNLHIRRTRTFDSEIRAFRANKTPANRMSLGVALNTRLRKTKGSCCIRPAVMLILEILLAYYFVSNRSGV